MKAHQRLIRETEAERDPRPVVPLADCRVAAVDPAFAREIILRYEWLGTVPKTLVASYGLIGPGDEPLGVSCFGLGGGTAAREVCGPEWSDRTLVLERGACVHHAHEHAGSFLTARALDLCAADHGARVFIAYSDAEAGEIGTIYQATNWLFLGPGNGRGRPGRTGRWYGRRVGEKAWLTSKSLRALRRAGTFDWAAARLDPAWEFRWVPDRSRYVAFRGSRNERRAARAALRYEPEAYPKRQVV